MHCPLGASGGYGDADWGNRRGGHLTRNGPGGDRPGGALSEAAAASRRLLARVGQPAGRLDGPLYAGFAERGRGAEGRSHSAGAGLPAETEVDGDLFHGVADDGLLQGGSENIPPVDTPQRCVAPGDPDHPEQGSAEKRILVLSGGRRRQLELAVCPPGPLRGGTRRGNRGRPNLAAGQQVLERVPESRRVLGLYAGKPGCRKHDLRRHRVAGDHRRHGPAKRRAGRRRAHPLLPADRHRRGLPARPRAVVARKQLLRELEPRPRFPDLALLLPLRPGTCGATDRPTIHGTTPRPHEAPSLGRAHQVRLVSRRHPGTAGAARNCQGGKRLDRRRTGGTRTPHCHQLRPPVPLKRTSAGGDHQAHPGT